MRKLIALLYLCTVLIHADKTHINQKLLLHHTTDTEASKEALLSVKIYFRETPYLKTLQETHDFDFRIEDLGHYHVLVISPIHSVEVRNTLLSELSPLFSDMFSIEMAEQDKPDKSLKPSQVQSKPMQNTSVAKAKIVQVNDRDLGLHWMVLLLLSAVGLVLSIRNRKKLSKIKEGQDEMQSKQMKIKDEIEKVGAAHA